MGIERKGWIEDWKDYVMARRYVDGWRFKFLARKGIRTRKQNCLLWKSNIEKRSNIYQ